RRAVGQLRHHRGPLHRVPGADRPGQPRSGHACRAPPPEPLPLPRLRHARLEPPRDPAPDLGRAEAEVQVVGDTARPVRSRPRVLGARGRGRARRPAGRLRRGARRSARRTPRRAGGVTAEAAPYKGLARYEEADAPYFFGRDADAELAVANVLAARLT